MSQNGSDAVDQLIALVSKLAPPAVAGFEKLGTFLSQQFHSAAENLPQAEHRALQLIEFVFGPKQILSQLVILIGLQITTTILEALRSAGNYGLLMLTSRGREQLSLIKSMSTAYSYQEWKNYAVKLDQLRGYDKWQKQDSSIYYDYRILKKRILDTVQMINCGDIFNLIFKLRGGLARDQFGVIHEGLFTKAMSGTKHLVEKYNDTLTAALDFVADSPTSEDQVQTR